MDKERKTIGVLKEKSLHNYLKYYFEQDEVFHEVKVLKYYADIKKGNNIIEIQTRGFEKLRNKLDDFLKDFQVNIVYPINYIKYLVWRDLDNNETKKRKSPKLGKIYDCFFELYKIKKYLNNKNLKITIVFINSIEYRYLDGYGKDLKKGSTKIDNIPYEVVRVNVLDFDSLIPDSLDLFTVKDYAQITKQTYRQASLGINILKYLNVIEVVSKSKNAFIYKKSNRKSIT